MSDPNEPARTVVPGWYPDPWFSGQQRFWDGGRWTSDVFADRVGAVGATAPVAAIAYGAPPTQPATTPPPPPSWGSAAGTPLPPALPAAEVLGSEPPRGATLSAPWIIGLVVAGLLAGGLGWIALRHDDPASRPEAATAPPTPTPPAASPTAPVPTPSPTAPSPTGPSTGPSPSGPHAALLANLVVRQRDVPSPYTVATISGGTQVDGQATLDLCQGTYPSEALRLERLQTAAFDQSGSAALSTEAVLYRSPAATAAAFAELRAVTAACTSPVTDPLTGATTTTTIDPKVDATWGHTPGVDRQAYKVTTTDESGQTRTTVAVYLKRGPVLLGVYFLDPTSPPVPVEGRTTIPTIVALFEQRLLNPPTGSGTGTDGGTGTTA